jgi:hypothetical protein
LREDQRSAGAPLLEVLLQVTKALLSEGCIVAVLDHSLDHTDLVGQTLLALGDMLISLSKEFAFLLHVGHGLLIMRLIAYTSHKIRRTLCMELGGILSRPPFDHITALLL